MIVTLDADADSEAVRRALVGRGLWVRRFEAGDEGPVQYFVDAGSPSAGATELRSLEGVASVATRPSPHPRLDRQASRIDIDGVAIGRGADPVLIAGPCSVESSERILDIAGRLAKFGVRFLRGGAYKSRTSPYTFQGHGARALRWMRDAADAHGMRVVTEAIGVDEVAPVAEVADLLQIGSRNMHNPPLLRAAAATGKPILLKRGMAATVEEWLLAAEYCLCHGAAGVIFCERGLRGFEPSTRNLLDLGSVALLAHVHRLPVIVDPSHAAGRRDLIAPLSRAAIAVGAAGLIIETHDDPGRALSDGSQALPIEEIEEVYPCSSRRSYT